jgi:tRNA(fMet)-specific endonuclease VapC
MSGKFLLDTNIVIGLFANDAKILQHLQNATDVFLSPIVLGELYYGAKHSAKVAQNVATVNSLAARVNLFPCDLITAQLYGDVKNDLQGKGRPIPENDIWIAATALQHNLTLVTRDSHFQNVTGLSLDTWT